jgi:SlyX protein
MDLQDRVMDLESRLAFQDDTIETLNDILVAQQRAVERLQLQMAALLKRPGRNGRAVRVFRGRSATASLLRAREKSRR